LQSVKQIDDPQCRRDAFDDLAFALETTASFTGDRALPHLLRIPDVPEEWKEMWRNR
jgi:hypothetical protein